MLATARNILKKAGFQPLKRLGQNFLADKNTVKKVIEAANLKPNDIVLEIGPGTGILTQEIGKRAKKVVAVEKDIKMTEILKETLKDFNNVKIIYGDILSSDILKSDLLENLDFSKSYKVVANLPYHIISPVIRQFLELVDIRYQPTEMILVTQREMAQRICAKVPKMNLLAVSVQFYAEPKIITYISKKSFWPRPKVDSAIIKITSHSTDRTLLENKKNKDLFFKIVKTGFSQPRKQLINNLSKGLKFNKIKVEKWLLKNNIQPSQRAETLNIKDWIKLTKTYQLLDC